ncbi:RNA-binding protein 28 [Epargyreus clarus]|uniref:RNA-binding protein 28 n=1 Tax=Epargyreus clarus TaxID=520877 RepID=UPI003C2EA41C
MTEGRAGDAENNTKFKNGVNRNARLVVKNISFKATEETFRAHFTAYGTVEEAKLLKGADGRLTGTGFVHYTHVPMANAAMQATNGKDFLGRRIFVSWAVPKHKYVQDEEKKKSNKNVIDEADIKEEESEDDSKPAKDDDKKNKVRINRNARLIVRNISFKATEETLKEHFEPYGVVQEVNLLKKPNGKLVGCAFVHFKNVPMAAKALENTNLKPFLGRPISVDWAVAKDKYMQHKVNQQIELEDQIKKEDSDDSDDENTTPMNVSNDTLKDEIKSESEDEDDDDEEDGENDDSDKAEAENSSDEDEAAQNGHESDEDSEEDGEDEDEEMNGANEESDDDDGDDRKFSPDKQRVKLNDAEDGCTVFLTNIPFSVDNDQLRTFAETIGPVKYALVCVDKLTEHSKGTGFVKFVNKEDADTFLARQPHELRLEGQTLQVKPALKKENLQQGGKKQPKDNRNLYLVKEGVIVAGSKAAVGVSAADMAKRLALERNKTQALKNLNRFVSRYRLVVANLPARCTDTALRAACVAASPRQAHVTECRVMRDLRAPVGADGKHPSKGFGFVMFTRHEDALACLRKLNNNPDVFGKNNRPIVSFSIEDRAALNARKKRLEKSIANNPTAKKTEQNAQSEQNNPKNRKNRKRKLNAPDESYLKKRKFEKDSTSNREVGKFVKRPKEFASEQTEEGDDYTGLTAKEGSQHKIRSNQKLRKQAELHKQNVKLEKKKNNRSLKLKMAARERVKQPKQKINKNKTAKRNKHRNRSRIDIR